MAVHEWLRPPRQMLAIFLAVALASIGTLGSLGWLLLKQDAALEAQRSREALEQAADRAASAMQAAIAELQGFVTLPVGESKNPPGDMLRISVDSEGATAWPEASLLYYPVASGTQSQARPIFSEGERSEFARNDLREAGREYSKLIAAADPAVRAGALARLARVDRKLHNASAALRAYDQLASIEHVDVDGIPSTLVARAGRASVFEETGRTDDLRMEAAALERDLGRGRWKLVKSTYEFYSSQAHAWLGTTAAEDHDRLARAEAVEWLSQNRAALGPLFRKALLLSHGPALAIGQTSPARLDAVVAGPAYLASLCAASISSNLRCGLIDPEGRLLVGDQLATRDGALRAASANGLPWTLQVSAPLTAAPAAPSPRRRLLVLSFTVAALVLVAGWYFIARGMTRELRVSRLQSDFVAAVSHEFRSPLTSLAHIADMLAHDRFPSDELRRRSYDVLVRDTDRLRRLVEGLLDFGRFEAGAAVLRLETVDIPDLVRTTAADFEERVASEGVSVELTMPVEAIAVRADREALSRALWNLLDNAVKYSPDCRTVWVETARQPNLVSISVRDRGLGIPLHEQREIFDRFVRGADSKARRIRGTGIGLAMVRQIVRAHGGEVRVASEPGKGSTFTVDCR